MFSKKYFLYQNKTKINKLYERHSKNEKKGISGKSNFPFIYCLRPVKFISLQRQVISLLYRFF